MNAFSSVQMVLSPPILYLLHVPKAKLRCCSFGAAPNPFCLRYLSIGFLSCVCIVNLVFGMVGKKVA